MHPFDIALVLLLVGTILFVCIPTIFIDARKEHGARRILLALGALLVVIGAIGFFGAALSALGGLNWLGPHFEWPVGYGSGVITTRDSIHIVPHTPSGRIQLYDARWRFLRGWQVDASAGSFKLVPGESNTVQVVTARGQRLYVFDLNGRLLSGRSYAPATYSSFPEGDEAYWVPTRPWLYVFCHPFLSWGCFVLGGVLMAIHDKLKKKGKRKRPAANPTGQSTSPG